MTVSRVFSLYSDIKEKYNLADRDNMLITPKINAALEVERLSDGLLRRVIEANHNYSVVDSQLVLFRSFKSFIETCSHHASGLIWVEKNNIGSFDNLCGFLSELIVQAKSEQRQDGVTLTSYSMLVHLIRNLIEDWIYLSKPTLSGTERFLSTFWQTAFDHYALVENTRSDSALWDVIGKILLNPSMEIDTSADILESVDFLETDFGENDHFDLSVRQLCCSNLSKAFALRVVAYEIHLTAGNEKSKNDTRSSSWWSQGSFDQAE
ncbi:hypothetical protein RMCBS344292_15970 [Rhizopus microsporus]|nr:hypothetical protein RMCBS344292_15970 [Rhizopus microsporus]